MIVVGAVGVIDGLTLVILCTLFVINIELEFLSFYSLTVLSLPSAEVSLAFLV